MATTTTLREHSNKHCTSAGASDPTDSLATPKHPCASEQHEHDAQPFSSTGTYSCDVHPLRQLLADLLPRSAH